MQIKTLGKTGENRDLKYVKVSFRSKFIKNFSLDIQKVQSPDYLLTSESMPESGFRTQRVFTR